MTDPLFEEIKRLVLEATDEFYREHPDGVITGTEVVRNEDETVSIFLNGVEPKKENDV